jgi:tRNA modification GTPase
MTASDQTICRLLTPSSGGAIAMIRLCGPRAQSVVSRCVRTRNGQPWASTGENRLHIGQLVDGDEVIDDVIVAYEIVDGCECVDVSTHGGARIIERSLALFERLNAKVAEDADCGMLVWPAKCELEREAIAALRHAKTGRAARFLAWQRANLTDRLLEVGEQAAHDPVRSRQLLRGMVEGYDFARSLCTGSTIALIGPPNSGKSTLFNRMVGRETAIVSPVAGTTRDWVQESIEIEGFPITLMDTAGHRATTDMLESLAIGTGQREVRRAELVVIILDGSSDPQRETLCALSASSVGVPRIFCVNKCDNPIVWDASAYGLRDPMHLSAKNGAGLPEFMLRISDELHFSENRDCAPTLFTDRQVEIARLQLSQTGDPALGMSVTIDRIIGWRASG